MKIAWFPLRLLRSAGLAAALPVCGLHAVYAQFADVAQAGGPVAINSAWRFHTGDDPQWAGPGFDDSHWSLLRLDKAWAEQGYKGYSGFAWYRVKVKLPATKSPLALGFSQINSADEIYADGRLIGSIGKMRPVPEWLGYSPTIRSFALPAALSGRTIELAVRTWQPQASSNNVAFIGRASYPLVGSAQTIANTREVSVMRFAMSHFPDWVLGIIEAGIGLFSLGLFFLRRRATEYAWAALFLLDSAALGTGSWFYRTYQWPAFDWVLGANCLGMGMLIFWLLFIWSFLRAPADRLLRAGIAILLLVPIPVLLARLGYVPLTDANLSWVIVPLVLVILVFARLVRLAWQGNREAQLLLVPFLLTNLMNAIDETTDFLYWVGALKTGALDIGSGHSYLVFYRGPAFSLSWEWLFTLLSDAAVAVLLMLRFTRSAERDERLSAEMKAAHSVQAQLVPAQLPPTPHFRLEAAYLAASEVGGDFYQVLPQADESVLIVLGDVSGKGLQAAMTGALAIGALRALAADDPGPAQLLAGFNREVCSAQKDGFITCLCLRIARDGRVVLANAGHLAPYCNGRELELESSLPLGIAANVEYAETTLQLAPCDTLTLLSDGVVEAKNLKGELFGFERAAQLSAQDAKSIARAAQHFGQEDDITVLTLTFAAAEAAQI